MKSRNKDIMQRYGDKLLYLFIFAQIFRVTKKFIFVIIYTENIDVMICFVILAQKTYPKTENNGMLQAKNRKKSCVYLIGKVNIPLYL